MITPVSLSFRAIFFLTFCSIFFYLESTEDSAHYLNNGFMMCII